MENALPPKAPRSLDAYLPASVRSSPSLMAQATRTPRTGPMNASAGPAIDDFALDGGSTASGAGAASASASSTSTSAAARRATPPALEDLEAAAAPQSPPRKTGATVSYTMGTLAGCDGLGAIDGSSFAPRRPPGILELHSPAGK